MVVSIALDHNALISLWPTHKQYSPWGK